MGNTQEVEKRSQKPQEKEEVPNFTCEICIEPMLSNKKFKNSNKCVHPFCVDCMAKYIHAKLEDNLANVQCPGLNCKEPLDPLSCRPIISTTVFDKWCDILRDSALIGFQRCYCPYRDCSVLVVNECGDIVKRSHCPNCKRLFCFECKMPWHPGYRCGEREEKRDKNDVLFGELVERKRWTRCPYCGHSVELVQGCRDVKCRCGTRFCHHCGEKSHFDECSSGETCHNGERGSRGNRWIWCFFYLFLVIMIFISSCSRLR